MGWASCHWIVIFSGDLLRCLRRVFDLAPGGWVIWVEWLDCGFDVWADSGWGSMIVVSFGIPAAAVFVGAEARLMDRSIQVGVDAGTIPLALEVCAHCMASGRRWKCSLFHCYSDAGWSPFFQMVVVGCFIPLDASCFGSRPGRGAGLPSVLPRLTELPVSGGRWTRGPLACGVLRVTLVVSY